MVRTPRPEEATVSRALTPPPRLPRPALASRRLTARGAAWVVLGVASSLLLLAGCGSPGVPAPPPQGGLAVHFIDAGQGDATLLVTEDATVLVDAGRHTATDVVEYLEGSGVTAIDVVAITHPHADHLGQFDLVMERFDVGEVWWSPTTHTTRTFDRALDALEASDAAYEEPGAGESTAVGSLRFEFANPPAQARPGDLHDTGLVFRVTYGDVAFLFSGDAEAHTEQRMVDTGSHSLAAEVYQVGHHGSATSTSEAFLAAVAPRLAVYSAGRDSRYGHPHDEVVERLTGAGVALYGTPAHGTVVVTTDGEDLQVQTATGAPPIHDPGERP